MPTPRLRRTDKAPSVDARASPPTQEFRILAVIPTLAQRLDTLGRTLESIQTQSGVRVDIVIVAKDVSPALIELAHRFDARVVANSGHISAAVNAGFSLATADHRYALWIGDDDLLRPESLAVASDLLENDSLSVACFGGCDYIDMQGNLLFTRSPPALSPTLLQCVPGLIKQEACLFRYSALVQCGGLDESLRYTMDLDLLLRLRRCGRFIKAARVQAAFCWHPGSLTIANRNASLNEAQRVQQRNARGLVKLLQPIWKHPIRWLIVLMARKINRAMLQA